MIKRPFFENLVEDAWRRRSIVWLKGVRRSGKTTLARSIAGTEYFDCELPRTAKLLEDPEGFFGDLRSRRVALDEIHRLEDPSRVLKVAADHFPHIKVLATGSSTLHATSKFRDTLAGRKTEVFLSPLLDSERDAFGDLSLKARLERGGLPPFALQESPAPSDYAEWLDAYFARDVMELFRLNKRTSFLKFARLLFDASKFSRECEVDRRTLTNFLSILEETHLALVLRPYHTSKAVEIVKMPKVCAFDTGFIHYARGAEEARSEELGSLFEQLVAQETAALLQRNDLNYWRDKQEREVDLIVTRHGKSPLAIEVKWSEKSLDSAGLAAFHALYPKAELVAVCQDTVRTHKRSIKGANWTITNLQGLAGLLGVPDRP
jgi:predicted AAA+ superfamily ATPase